MLQSVLPDLPAFAIDVVGWAAAGTVFLTFCMRTMESLRIIAVISNLAFIGYALAADLLPILVLHGALLPLNIARLAQMRAQVRRAAEARRTKDAGFEWLAEMGRSRRLAPGETLFARGDPADALFVILEGELEIVEFGLRRGPGTIVGEIGLFSAEHERTATVRAVGPVHLSELTEQRVDQLQFDNPRFARNLIRLVTGRLLENASRLETRIADADADAARREADH